LTVPLGEKIKAAREAANLTQDDLAYALRSYPTLERVTSSLISGWENDDVKRMSFPAVDAIAQVTGQPLDYFSERRAAGAVSIASPPASTAQPRRAPARVDAMAEGMGVLEPRPGGRRKHRTRSDEEQG
jgi:transcriptional regulator with XRE-family HTH domain